MSAGGELIPSPALRGEVLPPAGPPPPRERGAVFRDFTSKLRGYVWPPPPNELGWQAVAGIGMILGSAGLIALLPAGHSVRNAGLFRWVGSHGLASTLDSVGEFAQPLAIFAMIVLLGVAAIYITKWGAPPALAFLSAQAWFGVLAFAIALFGWGFLLVLMAVNVIIWVAIGAACLAVIGAFLGALGSS